MKGRITAYDPDSYRGEIQGHDGERYDFALQDWGEQRQPKEGDAVDFETDEFRGRNIYLDDYVLWIVKCFPEACSIPLSPPRRFFTGLAAISWAIGAIVCFNGGRAAKFADNHHVNIFAFWGLFLLCVVAAVNAAWCALSRYCCVVLTKKGIGYKRNIFTWEYASVDLLLPGVYNTRFGEFVENVSRFGLSKADAARAVERWCRMAVAAEKDVQAAEISPPAQSDTGSSVAQTA